MTRLHTVEGAVVPLPASASELTCDWFDAMFRTQRSSARVAAVEREPVAEGVGLMSCLTRVQLQYAEGDGPESVVVKLPTVNEQNRQVARTFDNYQREVRFYQCAAHRTPMRTPALYHADVDGDGNFVLVLEDLSAWVQGDQVRGATSKQAERCMAALAELHASFWNQVDEGDLDWMPDTYPSLMSDGLLQGTTLVYDAFNSHFSEHVPAVLRGLKERYVHALPRLQRWMNGAPRTVIHGDFRMDNLFFGRGPGAAMACCDWQGSLRGKGVHDVAYFLSGSLPVAHRRRAERQLLRVWLESLQAGGVTGYTFEDAWEDYRRAVLMLWCYVVIIGGGLDPSNTRGSRWVEAMVRRSCSAIEDLGCVDLLAEFEQD